MTGESPAPATSPDLAAPIVTPIVAPIVAPIVTWYAEHARDLPWRRPDCTPWGVLVSEVMLQQTPVRRVHDPFLAWMKRWPTPDSLAAEPPGAAVRAWGRLGYPRRALRLHAAARAIVAEHGGAVPSTYEALRRLPGVGDYTAAAVLSFAFGGRHVVLDTNVRRVLTRVVTGAQYPAVALTAAERRVAEALLPEAALAPRWAAATMELGATLCTARAPECSRCPVVDACAWRARGYPLEPLGTRRTQSWRGSDRQARGALLAQIRDRLDPTPERDLEAAWTPAPQRARALAGLLADGLVEVVPDEHPHRHATDNTDNTGHTDRAPACRRSDHPAKTAKATPSGVAYRLPLQTSTPEGSVAKRRR